MAAPKKYPDALRVHAVRTYQGSDPKPTFRDLALRLGVHHEALRQWVRLAEESNGDVPPETRMAKENKRLRQRVTELEHLVSVLRATHPRLPR